MSIVDERVIYKMKIQNNPQKLNQTHFGMKLSPAQASIYPWLVKPLKSISPIDAQVYVDHFGQRGKPTLSTQGFTLSYYNKVIGTVETKSTTILTPEKLLFSRVPKSQVTFKDQIITEFQAYSAKLKLVKSIKAGLLDGSIENIKEIYKVLKMN